MRLMLICWIALLCALPARAADRVMDVLDQGETPEQAAARLHKQAIKEDRFARDAAPERQWNAEAASLRVDLPSGAFRVAPPREPPKVGFDFGRREGGREARRDGEGGGRGSEGGDEGSHDDREHHDREHHDREHKGDGERDD